MIDKHITSTEGPEKAYVYSPFISDKASCGPTAAHFCAYFGQTAQERAAEWPVALFLLLRNFTLRPASGSAPPLHSSFALRLAQFRYRSLTPLDSGDAYVPLVAAAKHLCGSRSRAATSACAARPPVRFLSVRHSGVRSGAKKIPWHLDEDERLNSCETAAFQPVTAHGNRDRANDRNRLSGPQQRGLTRKPESSICYSKEIQFRKNVMFQYIKFD